MVDSFSFICVPIIVMLTTFWTSLNRLSMRSVRGWLSLARKKLRKMRSFGTNRLWNANICTSWDYALGTSSVGHAGVGFAWPPCQAKERDLRKLQNCKHALYAQAPSLSHKIFISFVSCRYLGLPKCSACCRMSLTFCFHLSRVAL